MDFLHIFKGGLLGSATGNNCEIIRKTELCRERVNCDTAVTEVSVNPANSGSGMTSET